MLRKASYRSCLVALAVAAVAIGTTAGGSTIESSELAREFVGVTARIAQESERSDLSAPLSSTAATTSTSLPDALVAEISAGIATQTTEIAIAGSGQSTSAPTSDSVGSSTSSTPDDSSSGTATPSLPSSSTPATAPQASTIAPRSGSQAFLSPPDSKPVSTEAPTTTVEPSTTTSTSVVPATTTTVQSTTTTRAVPTGPQTLLVGTDGTIQGGARAGERLVSVLRTAEPGLELEFLPGTHQPLKLDGVNGTAKLPIILTAADPSSPPIFSSNDLTNHAGIEIARSSHIAVQNVKVTKSLWGIRIERSSGISVSAANVTSIGQEGIRIVEKSSWVTIQNSRISKTGLRSGTAPDGQPYSTFGEGIYVGSGGGNSNDKVSHVTISGNTITATGTEAIDVKAPSSEITISGNTISGITTRTSGAVVLHASDRYSAANAGLVVRNNTISDIRTSSGHRDGVAIVVGSSAEVTANTIHNIQHYGIRVEDSGSDGSKIKVTIRNNSFSDVGLDPIWSAAERASLDVGNNKAS